MTDYDKVKQLLEELGVGFDEFPVENGKQFIELNTSDCKRVDGYPGFVTNFEFTAAGDFVVVGIWE